MVSEPQAWWLCVLTPLVKKINCLFQNGLGRRSNGVNVELGFQFKAVFLFPNSSKDLESLFGDLPLMRKNLFRGTNEVTYHSRIKDDCYLYSSVGYAILLGGI
ncbi:hypothetical protein AMTRI_Chr01g129210 [Amborella trichopoda]